MNPPKRVLFASLSAGGGHVRAAEALLEACKQKYPEVEAHHLDLASSCGWLTKQITTSSYEKIAKHVPTIYGELYRQFNRDQSTKLIYQLAKILKIDLRRATKQVKEINPDLVICTNFLAPAMLSHALGDTPFDMTLTDYDFNRVFVSPNTRRLYAPTEEIKNKLIAYGQTAFYTGIPIHPIFKETKNIEEIKRNLNLDFNEPVILSLSGGSGFADYTWALKNCLEAHPRANFIAVSGRGNPRLFKKLSNLADKYNNFHPIEYTNKIHELMAAADVIITKPGGLTTTEALTMKKPLLLVSPIPGNEDANVTFVETNNYGLYVFDLETLAKKISDVLAGKIKFAEPLMPKDAAGDILEKAFT
ncbi:MAG: glycosyltransferase [Patescibacteria group bacterium]